VCAFAATCVVGVGGGRDLFAEHGGRHEMSALALLGAMMALPILGYFALHLQGRARLALEDARKWSDPYSRREPTSSNALRGSVLYQGDIVSPIE
jgi:hypothetical protein